MKRHLEPTTRAMEANARFVARRDEISKRLLLDGDGVGAAHQITDATDAWIREIWQAAGGFPGTFVALGGYGRRELCHGSDVDLVVEVDDDAPSSSELLDCVEKFVAWTRLTRVKVAHAIRTAAQTHDAFSEDIRTAVSYLDARPLDSLPRIGAADAAELLRSDDDGASFVDVLLEGYRARLARFGQTIYLLEPDLKSGKGSLRDLHTICWAATVRGVQLNEPEIAAGHRWLMNVRGLLHAIHGRKHDRLHFPDQERVAKTLFAAADDAVGAELLMREHYRTTRAIAKLAERVLRQWAPTDDAPGKQVGIFHVVDGQLVAPASWSPTLNDVLETLDVASKAGLLLDPETEKRLEDTVENSEPATPATFARFRELLTGRDQSDRTSTRLLELGVIPRLVPEFEPVVCHVQHDVYHVFTTDVHLLRCLEFARSLLRVEGDVAGRWPQFARIAQRIEDPDVFLLSALFHDIGKNRGGGHSERGAVMALDFGPRLGLSDEQTTLVSFLIREHLSLAHAARRHDLSDRRLVRDLASRIRSVEALNQLTALTFCDMSTVGAGPITDWNASLLLQLHQRLDATIRHGTEAAWLQLEREVDFVRQWLRDEVEFGPMYADAFVRDLPASYLVEASPTALARAFDAWRRGRTGDLAVVTTPEPDRGSTEVIISAPDVPGVLAQITGAISSMGLNILDARIITTSRGRLLDIFQVAQSGGASHALDHAEQSAVTDEHRLRRLRDRLRDVLTGEAHAEQLLEQRQAERKLRPRETPTVDSSVEVLDVSDDFTVIQVKAPDRLGLLYDIARTLADCEVDIRLSKIDSEGTQVVDTFYLETLSHQQLSQELTERVCGALARVIED